MNICIKQKIYIIINMHRKVSANTKIEIRFYKIGVGPK